MEFENKPYSVYVKTDDKNRITAINSDAFISSLDGWIKIDEGIGDKYQHAQGNYLSLPLMEERGLYQYKLLNNVPVRRTQEEIDADYQPIETPTQEERLAQLEAALTALLEGATE